MSNEPVDRIRHLEKYLRFWLWGTYSRSLADSILSRLDAVKLMIGCPLFPTAKNLMLNDSIAFQNWDATAKASFLVENGRPLFKKRSSTFTRVFRRKT